ncbi:zinc finger protein ZFP2 [Penaeus vannamei]|uniref:zinc finger protein ZFP2 n=1 Tax=Penaeus vannamei TaxID=6689 RepID=UPI00387F6264
MAPRGKKKEASSPRKQLNIKGFFKASMKRERDQEESPSKAEKAVESPKKRSRQSKQSTNNNNNNAEKDIPANNNNNNNNNNNEKPTTPEKKGKGSAAQEKPAASKRKQKQKQEQPPPVDVEEEESDPLYIADVDDLTGSDKEDDPDPVLSIADSPSKETFILTPQSPVQKEQTVRFKCKVCDQWFPNRYFQRKHMLMEHEDQRYECRVCSFNSVDPEKLKSHIIKQHVTKKERSESVSLDAVQVDLDELMTKHTPRKVMMEDGVALGRDASNKMRFICAMCERIYTSKYSLERHVRCHTGEKPYTCDVCNFSTSYREHMQRHMTSVHLIVHSDEPKQKYVPKNRRKTEDKTVQPEDDAEEKDLPSSNDPNGSFNSNDGSVSSNDTTSSAGKKRRNILRKRFECAACGLKATHKTDLVNHIKEKHPKAHIESLRNGDGSKVHLIVTVSKKPVTSRRMVITCPDCSKVFHDTWKYKVHMRSHTGVKPFGCSVCSFYATSKMTVRDHIHRKHKDIQNPKILLRTVCIDGTVDHVELTMPQREFKCEFCDEVFQDNYHMKQHKKKSHTEALPFSCVDCGHREWARANIIIHCMQKHPDTELDALVLRNGKPLTVGLHKLPKCDQCDKIFPYQSQLYIHQKQHTGERSYFCDICNYSTNHKTALSRHIHKHLEGEDEAPKKTGGRKKGAKAASKNKDSDAPINFVNVETPPHEVKREAVETEKRC